jgi:hypothetical protein
MNTICLVIIIVLSGVVVSISVCAPDTLAENEFLKSFINQEILNILAVIMTISITSIATIHIWFNELEDKHEKKVFRPARREINQNAFFLLWCFVVELILLIVRSFFMNTLPYRYLTAFL